VKEHQYFDRVIAVEPTPGLADTCRKKGLETIEDTVENLRSIMPNSVDAIANFEVIEHLADPFLFVKDTVQYLRKGSLFVCSCPSIEGIGTIVLKEKAKVIDHEHVNYFTPKSLGILLERAGLEVLETATPGELDTDLLKNAFFTDGIDPERFPFLFHLFSNSDENVLRSFQEFLKANLLSSHLWIISRKK